jgi:hypothetical protein
MFNETEMVKALQTFFQDGDVFEVRVLGATSAANKREHIEFGYFDYSHIDTIADSLSHLKEYKGIYVTINPVDKDLQARAYNRIRIAGRGDTTADSDIPCRKWFMVDCDPVRKSGISATQEEHDYAQEKARGINDYLSCHGWAQPIVLDSGNGAQLLYRMEGENTDTNSDLWSKALKGLSNKFSDDKVNIDMSIFNPARIWRLPGTKNCKGDNTADRPHRFAKIISVPEDIKNNSIEALKPLCPAESQKVTEIEEKSSFNLEQWIATYIPEIAENVETWKDGKKWVFDVCPFNPDHDNRSAVITQQANGAIGFTCHHNGCINNGWKELRALYEPESAIEVEPLSQETIEAICESARKDTVVETVSEATEEEHELTNEEFDKLIEEHHPWNNITENDVHNALENTLIGELAKIYSSVSKPPLPLSAALIKAIVTAGCCLSGEASLDLLNKRYGGGNISGALCKGISRGKVIINTGGGQGCNIYALLAGNSASGKDIGNLLDFFANFPNPSAKVGDDGFGDYMLGTGGSAEGLADVLAEKPNGLLLISEMRDWLDAKHWKSKATSFLTQAFNKAMFEESFSGRSGKSSKRKADYCAPNILASVQPEVLARLASIENIETGFFGRFLCVLMPRFYGLPKPFNLQEKLKAMKSITDIFCRKEGVVDVPDNYAESLQKEFLGNTEDKMIATWRRLINEYYPRLAVMLSVTTDFRTHTPEIEISQETWDKARILVMFFYRNAEALFAPVNGLSQAAKDNMYDYSYWMEKVLNKIKELYEKIKQPVTKTHINRAYIYCNGERISSAKTNEVLTELIEIGAIKKGGKGYIPLS